MTTGRINQITILKHSQLIGHPRATQRASKVQEVVRFQNGLATIKRRNPLTRRRSQKGLVLSWLAINWNAAAESADEKSSAVKGRHSSVQTDSIAEPKSSVGVGFVRVNLHTLFTHIGTIISVPSERASRDATARWAQRLAS